MHSNDAVDDLEANDRDQHREVNPHPTNVGTRKYRAQGTKKGLGETSEEALGARQSSRMVSRREPTKQS